MEFPAGESTCSNSSVWSQIHSRSPNLFHSSNENGFASAGFTPASGSTDPAGQRSAGTLLGCLCTCLARARERMRSCSRRLAECVLSPVPRRVYGISTEDRFRGASAPANTAASIASESQVQSSAERRFAGATAPTADKDRFAEASAPSRRPLERGSSNSDSPPYLPSQPRSATTVEVGDGSIEAVNGQGGPDGFRHLAV